MNGCVSIPQLSVLRGERLPISRCHRQATKPDQNHFRESPMTSKRSRPFHMLLLGAALAIGASLASPAQAEELRIGFLAPTTGIFAQVGKEMTDGIQLYLSKHNGELGGTKIKLIIEDTV